MLLDKINNIVQSKTLVNQGKDTSLVNEWFINIKNKESSSFIVFDIESFYPSISEDLFKSAIWFAKESIDITHYNLSLINQAWKTLLFHKNTPWVNKEGNKDFGVPRGCFDCAQVCELVRTFILNQLNGTFQNHSVGLDRDDGIAVVKGLSGPEIERMKKRVIKTFKYCELKIIKGNLKTVNFLDVRFNLPKNIFEPYKKPDNQPVYINVNSNHPPSTIPELPKSIRKRLSELSCNKEIFEKAIPPCNDALNKSGFKENLVYTPRTTTSLILCKKQRKCKIVWFNLPYSADANTNTDKIFSHLLKKHFGKKNNLHKIFNKNNVKISYSCISNIPPIMAGYNKSSLETKIT